VEPLFWSAKMVYSDLQSTSPREVTYLLSCPVWRLGYFPMANWIHHCGPNAVKVDSVLINESTNTMYLNHACIDNCSVIL